MDFPGSHPDYIDNLIKTLSKLPGFGKRSAARAVLHIIKNKNTLADPLIENLKGVRDNISVCSSCFNIDISNPCSICSDPARSDIKKICVLEDIADLWAIERSNIFKGLYHVLGGTLSALEGIGPDELKIDKLIENIISNNIEEIILATNATVDGQTTAHYIANRLKDRNLKITRLAHGIPIGGELEYLDEGTLSMALNSRNDW